MINNHNDLYRTVLAIWLDFYVLYSAYFFQEFWFWKKYTELKIGGFND